MKNKLVMILLALGYWAALIGAVAMFGVKAGALMILACCCSAGAATLDDMKVKDESIRPNDAD